MRAAFLFLLFSSLFFKELKILRKTIADTVPFESFAVKKETEREKKKD